MARYGGIKRSASSRLGERLRRPSDNSFTLQSISRGKESCPGVGNDIVPSVICRAAPVQFPQPCFHARGY